MFAKPTPRTYATLTMYTGMAATLAGNALAADWSDAVGVVISAFPAFALFVVFEMVIRSKANPSRRRWYHQAMRLVPALAIMGIAAKVSLGHLIHLADAHGQHGANAVLFGLLPDAMMILAAVVLKDSPQARTTAATRKAPAAAAPAAKKAPAAKAAKAPRARKTATQPSALVPGKVATVTSLITVPPVPSRRTRTVATA